MKNETLKASDLKTGNYVHTHNGHVIKLVVIDSAAEVVAGDNQHSNDHSGLRDLDSIRGIPLEEWLIKFGFKNNGSSGYTKGVFTITHSKRFDCYLLWKAHGANKDCHIMNLQYVHTLQNAWPILCHNEELTLKE